MTVVGAPTWVDLSVADVNAEAAFYGRLLGWEFPPAHPGAGGWIQANCGGQPAAGIQPRPPGMPMSAWTVYFTTSDINAALALVTELGGSVLFGPMPVDVDGQRMCSIATVSDPAGAVFGLTEPGVHRGFGTQTGHGATVWFELLSRDLPASLEFYRGLLDAGTQAAPGVPMEYILLSVDGKDFGGAMAMPEGVPPQAPSYWSAYFAVDDADEAVRVAAEAGATVLMGPETMAAGRLASLMDPEGALFNVITGPEQP